MGGNPRYQTWSPAQWRQVAPTVADLRRHRYEVIARCLTCSLAMDVALADVAKARGDEFVLWGRSARCRRRHCQGRMQFWCVPPRLGSEVEMW